MTEDCVEFNNSLLTKKKRGVKKWNHTYSVMLEEAYSHINPETNVMNRLPFLKITRVGAKKLGWVNFKVTCDAIRRTPEQVTAYLFSELATTGFVDATGMLIFEGKFRNDQVESLFKKYVWGYVSCMACKSLNTSIEKDASSRLNMLTCATCGSQRAVAAVNSGFKAVGRGDRKK